MPRLVVDDDAMVSSYRTHLAVITIWFLLEFDVHTSEVSPRGRNGKAGKRIVGAGPLNQFNWFPIDHTGQLLFLECFAKSGGGQETVKSRPSDCVAWFGCLRPRP